MEQLQTKNEKVERVRIQTILKIDKNKSNTTMIELTCHNTMVVPFAFGQLS